MIFADKLIALRRKCGWTQEELAEKLEVTRQAVSKWEGAQSIPELDKILQLSNLFGVSTDYLLRDELEAAETALGQPEPSAIRRVSMEEASAFLDLKQKLRGFLALGTFLCIFSPVPLLTLAALSDGSDRGDALAAGLGMFLLLALVAAAVGIFLWTGGKTSRYAYLDTEDFETEYGVTGMVRARREQFRSRYVRGNIIGTVLCVLSPIPLICGLCFAAGALPERVVDQLSALLTGCLLLLAGAGVVFFVLGGSYWESMEMLLQEGAYTARNKRLSRATRFAAPAFWMTAAAVYVGYSLLTNDWARSWIIWPVAALLFVPTRLIARALAERRMEKPD